MSIPLRQHQAGTFFLTAACAQRRRIFQVDRNAQLFIDVLAHYRSHYRLHAFVVMPDHFHLLLTPTDVPLERAMQYIKGGFSHRFNADRALKAEVWQKSFIDHRIRDIEDYIVRKQYLLQNPVVRGLASSPQDYRWSSAAGVLATDGDLSG